MLKKPSTDRGPGPGQISNLELGRDPADIASKFKEHETDGADLECIAQKNDEWKILEEQFEIKSKFLRGKLMRKVRASVPATRDPNADHCLDPLDPGAP